MGGVIRKEDLNTPAAFRFDDLEKRGREILARANAEAIRILNDANRRAQAMIETHRRQARDAGLAQGRQEGAEEARQETRRTALAAAKQNAQHTVAALGAALADFDRQKRSLLALAESGLIELAVAIARRVCKTQIAASGEAARANVRALLENAKRHADVEIRVHPADHELLRDIAPELAQNAAELEHARFVPDSAVGRGGCILRTREGVIDATIDTQLDRIAAALCPPTDDTHAVAQEVATESCAASAEPPASNGAATGAAS